MKTHPEKRSKEPRGAGSAEKRKTPSLTGTAGARQPEGKSSESDAVLRKGLQPKSEPTRNAVEVPGAALRAINEQLRSDEIDGTSSSPKKRTNWEIL